MSFGRERERSERKRRRLFGRERERKRRRLFGRERERKRWRLFGRERERKRRRLFGRERERKRKGRRFSRPLRLQKRRIFLALAHYSRPLRPLAQEKEVVRARR
jgi:hypothetical protein